MRSAYKKYTAKDGYYTEYLYYRCSSPLKIGICGVGAISANDLEYAIALLFAQIRIPDNWQKTLLNRLKKRRKKPAQTKDQLKRRLENINYLFEIDQMGRKEYDRKRLEIESALARLKPLKIDKVTKDTAKLLANFAMIWQQATRREQQRLIASIVESIEMDQDKETIYATVIVKRDLRLLFDLATDGEALGIRQKRNNKGKN